MHELSIKQDNSSAYYPESQCALERFNQTLKNMTRSYCFGTEKIGMKAYIFYYLMSENLYKSHLDSVHLNLYLGIRFVDLCNL